MKGTSLQGVADPAFIIMPNTLQNVIGVLIRAQIYGY